jgi:hypothetical protein
MRYKLKEKHGIKRAEIYDITVGKKYHGELYIGETLYKEEVPWIQILNDEGNLEGFPLRWFDEVDDSIEEVLKDVL